MSTFLQLCQSVARESGTIADLTQPSTVASQTGRLLRIVNWTADAYKDIQRRRTDWEWMRDEFSGPTLVGTQRYLAAAMGIARFHHWIFNGEEGEHTFSCFLPADGRDTESKLVYMPWTEFRRTFLFGSAADDTGKPQYVTVDPAGQLAFYPIPDAAYTVRGEYYKSPQTLSADADLPEMPETNHDAIKWRALILMGVFDEATEQVPAWGQFFAEQMSDLMLHQTPRIRLGEPLA